MFRSSYPACGPHTAVINMKRSAAHKPPCAAKPGGGDLCPTTWLGFNLWDWCVCFLVGPKNWNSAGTLKLWNPVTARFCHVFFPIWQLNSATENSRISFVACKHVVVGKSGLVPRSTWRHHAYSQESLADVQVILA